MAEPEGGSGCQPSCKRRASPEFAERKSRQKTSVTTVAKTGLTELSKHVDMTGSLEDNPARDSGSQRRPRAPSSGPKLNFFRRCLSSIVNIDTDRSCADTDPELYNTFLVPDDYVPIERTPTLTRMYEYIAQQTKQSFAVSVAETFLSRLWRWFRCKVYEFAMTSGRPYFIINEASIIKSLVSVLITASTQESSSVESLLPRCTRLPQASIPGAERHWLQRLVNCVRGRIGPLPLHLKESPKHHNQQLSRAGEDNGRALKLFTLLPVKRLRPMNIKIDNMILNCLNKEIKTICAGRDGLPEGDRQTNPPPPELWAYFFGLNRIARSSTKKFMSFRFKRLKWKTYIRTQRAYAKIALDLGDGSSRTLVVWRDARFPAAGRGSAAVPTSTLRRKVGERLTTVGQNEFRTSKLRCPCHQPMEGLRDSETGLQPWALRVCTNNACPRSVWNRNVSAAINILTLFLCRVRGEQPPPAFRRGRVEVANLN